MCSSSKVVSNFIQDFAFYNNLDPDTIISIKVESDGTTTYEYADLKVGGIHRVQDFKRV
jgi:hypothetical protein